MAETGTLKGRKTIFLLVSEDKLSHYPDVNPKLIDPPMVEYVASTRKEVNSMLELTKLFGTTKVFKIKSFEVNEDFEVERFRLCRKGEEFILENFIKSLIENYSATENDFTILSYDGKSK